MKKFQLKLVAERFITVTAESEERLLRKLETMNSKELRDVVGLPEWNVDQVSDMPQELDAELLLDDGKFWTSN